MSFVYEKNLSGEDLVRAARLAAKVGETELADIRMWSPLDGWVIDREREAVLQCFALGWETTPHAKPGGTYYLFVNEVPYRIFVVLRSIKESAANGGPQSVVVFDRVHVMTPEGSPSNVQSIAALAQEALLTFGGARFLDCTVRVNLA